MLGSRPIDDLKAMLCRHLNSFPERLKAGVVADSGEESVSELGQIDRRLNLPTVKTTESGKVEDRRLEGSLLTVTRRGPAVRSRGQRRSPRLGPPDSPATFTPAIAPAMSSTLYCPAERLPPSVPQLEDEERRRARELGGPGEAEEREALCEPPQRRERSHQVELETKANPLVKEAHHSSTVREEVSPFARSEGSRVSTTYLTAMKQYGGSSRASSAHKFDCHCNTRSGMKS